MQSRWSLYAFLVVAFLGVGAAIGQETSVVAPDPAPVAASVNGGSHSSDCGCGNSGGGYSVEGCLKGREILQSDAEALWNGYCEGDCRVGHSKDHHRCGRHCGGNAGCGQTGFGFPGCGNQGCGGCGNSVGFPRRAHGADCGCDQCRGGFGARLHSGAGLGARGNCGCNDCGGGSCFGWAGGCGNGCHAGAGRVHSFGLGCRCACKWDNMCDKDSFGPSATQATSEPAPVAVPSPVPAQ